MKEHVRTYKGRLVRVMDDNGVLWFLAKDVARILGYRDANSMIRRLDEDERKLYRMSGAGREMNIIDEGALFTILIGSTKKEAADFKSWLTKDCIPGIYPAKKATPAYGIRITVELIQQGAR